MTLFNRPFQPRLGFSIAAFVMFLILIGLGSWQVVRLEWKQGVIDERQARWSAPAEALPQDISDEEALLHRRVVVEGRYRHDEELYLPGRSYKGSAGVGVVTPFEMTDGRGLLVYRGWVPSSRQEPETRSDSNPEGIIQIEGVVLPGGWQGSDWVEPGNDAERNAWFFVDPADMASTAGLQNPIIPIYLGLYREDQESSLPFTPPPPMDIRNDHLQYAITWYALSLALIVIYVVFSLGPKRSEEEPDA
ncbi:MAG: SURF1 family protein [Kiloniellales bacterium]